MRYTSEQVERGINHFLSEYLAEPFVLDLDSPLDIYWRRFNDLGECPLECLEALGQYFGIQIPQDRAAGWLKLSEVRREDERRPGKRFVEPHTPRKGRDLVTLIRRRARCASFQPRNLFGHSCKKAGLFLGIRETIGQRVSAAPSTHLRRALSTGEYRDLVKRLSWILDCPQIEKHAKAERSGINTSIGVLAFFAWISFSIALIGIGGFGMTAYVCFVITLGITFSVAAAWVCEAIKRSMLVELAPGINTFRDLVEAIESEKRWFVESQ